MIPFEHVVALSFILFSLGVVGALTRRNIIVILMSIELMLNAVNLAFVAFNRMWAASASAASIAPVISQAAPPLDGQVFALMIISVAAAEIAVGLAILISLVRNRDSINIEEVSLLRW